MVNATGGAFYSPCVDNPGAALQAIVDAVSGAASQFQLTGSPISSTIKVGVVRIGTGGNGTTDVVPRDKDDGFDYDPASNSIFFRGATFRPNQDDLVVISYRLWLPPEAPCGGNVPAEPDLRSGARHLHLRRRDLQHDLRTARGLRRELRLLVRSGLQRSVQRQRGLQRDELRLRVPVGLRRLPGRYGVQPEHVRLRVRQQLRRRVQRQPGLRHRRVQLPVPRRLRRRLRRGDHLQHVAVRVRLRSGLRRGLPWQRGVRSGLRMRVRLPVGLRRLPGQHGLQRHLVRVRVRRELRDGQRLSEPRGLRSEQLVRLRLSRRVRRLRAERDLR